MPDSRVKLGPWLRLARVSNLPTCWSNVLVGASVGVAEGVWPWDSIGMAMAAVSLFYIGGMALNDVADAAIDRVERPSRPIPSGAIAVVQAWVFIGVCFSVGLSLLAWISTFAALYGGALIACIVAYNFLHKRWPAAVLLMGACRGLIYLVSAAAVSSNLNWRVLAPLAGIITAYIVAITLIARIETRNRMDGRKWIAVAIPIVVLGAASFVAPDQWLWPAVFGVAMVGWLGYAAWRVFQRPPRIMLAILAWLAGICLVDAYFLTLLGQSALACAAVGCYILTRLGHRKITGT